MNIKYIDCQGCNNHCPLTVYVNEGEIEKVTGYCCHRGLVSAKAQMQVTEKNDSSFTGTREMYCKSCSNHCKVLARFEEGELLDIETMGCRRALVSIKKQLGN